MISVCIPLKNRVVQVKRCIESLDALEGVGEIVIGDFQSDDTDFKWLKDVKTPIKVINIEGDFSIGKGKNVAAENAVGDILFFLDADLIVPQEVIDKIQRIIPLGYVYCPIMFLENQTASGGDWGVHSYGQIAVTRGQWEANKWPEWTSYGGDDNHFFAPYKEGGAIRDQVFGFIHKWHSDHDRTKHYRHEPGTHLTQWNIEHYGIKAVPDLVIDEQAPNS